MTKVKFSLAHYTCIGERPLVILLNREQGKFSRQFNTVAELRECVGDQVIYRIVDENDNCLNDLISRPFDSSWFENKVNWEKLAQLENICEKK